MADTDGPATATAPATTAAPGVIPAGDHEAYMRLALQLATQAPARATNYRVGAVLVDTARDEIVATGYTSELAGNTHAEQCCLAKAAAAAARVAPPPDRPREVLPDGLALYTTMEPCSLRLSGNESCVQRILALGDKIATVYVGVREPDKFVADNSGRRQLEARGIAFVHVPGLEKDILDIATAGHEKDQAT